MNRLEKLRRAIRKKGGVGFLVPRTDEYQGEYVAPNRERLAWISDFTGSAGLAIILQDKAAVFTDGRYTLQATSEIDTSLYEIRHSGTEPPIEWVLPHLEPGQKLLFDPWLHTLHDTERWAKACDARGIKFTPIEKNLIDDLWLDQPAPPATDVYVHDVKYAGRKFQDKIKDIVAVIEKRSLDAVLLTASDSIAWALNIRASDIPHTPVMQGFAIIHKDETIDVITTARSFPKLDNSITVHTLDALPSILYRLKDKRILIDPSTAPSWFLLAAPTIQWFREADPCILHKAIKNTVEIDGARHAHLYDGVAVTKFLHRLHTQIDAGNLVTELSASDQLEAFRREEPTLTDLSFDTIAGAGPHGAIIHYRATPETNVPVEMNSLFLLDSGGQYLTGTTDITRTIAIGTPTAEQKENFTRVLKGHIALASAVFPEGTSGGQLDVLARQALWQAGLDYDHGTGHGVGSYLSVHEGPQRISKRGGQEPLKPGMIVSNEPGYYKPGEYGIRIENLVIVVPASSGFLKLETLTLVPIDLTLVMHEMLTPGEQNWINDYHARVLDALLPYLDIDTAAWLMEATEEV